MFGDGGPAGVVAAFEAEGEDRAGALGQQPLTPVAAAAGDAETAPGGTLEEVVVTATRRSERLTNATRVQPLSIPRK